jgi:hypothetical protein
MGEDTIQIEMPTSSKLVWLCYKEKGGDNDDWQVNEEHEYAVAMEDIIDTYDNEYRNDKKNNYFEYKDSEINHGPDDNDDKGTDYDKYYVHQVKVEVKDYIVISSSASSQDFNNYIKQQGDNGGVSSDRLMTEDSKTFLSTGKLILEQNDIKFMCKGIFLCIFALFVSIIIMIFLEVFVMFFDDDLTSKIRTSQHSSKKHNTINTTSGTIQSTTIAALRTTLPPVSVTTIASVRTTTPPTSTALPLAQPTTSRTPNGTSTPKSGSNNLFNRTNNNSSR